MKNYKIIVTDRKLKQILLDTIELSKNSAYLKKKYTSRYQFHENKVNVKVSRHYKKPGIQTNLIDLINESTQQG